MTSMEDVTRTTIDAYIRFQPRLYGEITHRGVTSAPVPTSHPRAPLGQVGYRNGLAGPEFLFVVRVNNDTIYGGGWVDLSDEPVIIKVPEVEGGRFWNIQVCDRWTNVLPGIGSRRGSEVGLYALVGPTWSGSLPPDVHEVRTTENLTFAFYRVGYSAFDDADRSQADLDQAADVLRRFTAVPLSVFLATGAPEQAPRAADLPAPPLAPRTLVAQLAMQRPLTLLGFLRAFVALPDCPLSDEERALLDRFGAFLDQAQQELASSASDQPTAAAMIQGLQLARGLIDARVRDAAPGDNGWVAIKAGLWDGRWLDRAAIAEYAIWANRPDSSIYPEVHTDALGLPLHGASRYTMRFAAGSLPPVEDFWSITLYRGDTLTLVENPIDRYSIGDRTPGLRYGDDGSLTLYIQKDTPGEEHASNWLPCPAGEFNLMMRFYGPTEAIANGTYKLPGLYSDQEVDFLTGQQQMPG